MEIDNTEIKTVAIVGSRTFNNRVYLWNILNELKERLVNITDFVSGGAKGADKEGEFWARKKKLKCTIFYPDYEKYGKKAPLMRNTDIIKASDIVIAFPTKDKNKSKGTNDSIKKARKFGKILYIFDDWE